MRLILVFVILGSINFADASILERKYIVGETQKYRILNSYFTNGNPTGGYEGRAISTVKTEAGGVFFEEIQWTKISKNGSSIEIPADFRQYVSHDPRFILKLPPLTLSNSAALFDTLNFYANYFVAMKSKVQKAGDHDYVDNLGVPATWTDGKTVIFGADCIDFDITLLSVSGDSASIRVVNTPSKNICNYSYPTELTWLSRFMKDTSNNWFNVVDLKNGSFVVQYGLEVINTVINVNLSSGKILSASMHNPVTHQTAICKGLGKDTCGDFKKETLSREVFFFQEH